MPLEFVRSDEATPAVAATVEATTETPVNVEVVGSEQTYSIVETKSQLKNEIANTAEVDKLVSTIDIRDTNSIVKFGSDVAEQIAQASDQVLRSMNMSQIDGSSEMLNALAKIMEQFDAKELSAEEKKGLFQNLRKQLDKIIAKYDNMGRQVDKVEAELKKYEKEIMVSNQNLEKMYQSNIDFYKQLLVYIAAGEQACVELDDYITKFRAEAETNPESGTVAMDLQTLEQTRSIMEQRVMDLKIAENVAMQSIPMLKTMEFSNTNLVRKINSAFIITLPVFKQALAQAIMLKRQKVQADAMSVLDQKTNELLIKNAQNTVAQSKMIAQMANGSSIKVDTLETTWRTIVDGITETKNIQDAARIQRAQDSERLEKLKADYYEKMSKTGSK